MAKIKTNLKIKFYIKSVLIFWLTNKNESRVVIWSLIIFMLWTILIKFSVLSSSDEPNFTGWLSLDINKKIKESESERMKTYPILSKIDVDVLISLMHILCIVGINRLSYALKSEFV